jgi:starch-binding outer membrane protein, SusD/RagB family
MSIGIKHEALRGVARRLFGGVAVLGLATAVACDTTVTNPGPVQEDFLNDPDAQPAVVAGMGRALAQGMNWVAYTTAAVAREIHPAGSTGSFGITVLWQSGRLERDDNFLDTHWQQAQRARWYAEDGIRRMKEEGIGTPELLAQANLWAGFSNRLLGENFCDAVIDGGALQAHTEYLTRAEAQFDQAIEDGAGPVQTAAYAGRASVWVQLGDWPRAVADAGQVPDDFLYVMPYYDGLGDPQRNRIVFAAFNQPYRAHTQWNTKYEEIGYEPNENPDGDPRVPWTATELGGDAAIECCGIVPFWPQAKYPSPGSDMPLAKGAEMRLIEAEAMLRDGDWEKAIDHINDRVRGPAGVPAAAAASLDEAWTVLKEERGIVLWLEGRRLGDLRRWDAEGTPGDLHPLEVASGSVFEGSHLVRQDLCIPTPPIEQDTNPNVPRS